jgi:DNA helicase II / ATP-dependent DNA helicase PcrA
MNSLSLNQLAIVQALIGQPIQVLASAGSGKTRVLTERIRYILENRRKDGIIALTFTNKAAEEMISRLADIEDIEERCWITTIHSVAQRILDQYGHTIGLPSELHIYDRDQDRKTIFIQSLKNNGIDIGILVDSSDAKVEIKRDKLVRYYMEHFSVVKRDLLNDEEIMFKYEYDSKFLSIFKAYQAELIESGGIDFDDILVYAHRVLLEQSWCSQVYRAKYKHICVDEAQDLNRAQYEFLKALSGGELSSFLMVGDPNQMIYGFNGSSHDYLCQEFVEDFCPTQYLLKENFRSSRSVINLANKVRPGSQVEADLVLDGRKEIVELEDEEKEALWIFSKIHELLLEKTSSEIEGEISLDKMVVIARNRFVFKKLEDILAENGISFSLQKSERFADPISIFAKVLNLGIRLRINMKNWVDGKKLCSVLKVQIPKHWGQEDLLSVLAQDVRTSDILYPDLQADLLLAIQSLDPDSPNILKFCSDFSTYIKRLASENSSSLLDELERSVQELQDFKKSWILFKKKGLGDSLISFQNAIALGQLVGEVNASGLTLSTVHTMKGLEKDIVFLMGMCEGIFPDYRADNQEKIEEERNNAFVAITRSRRWIFITYPKSRMMPWGDNKVQRASRFITEMASK